MANPIQGTGAAAGSVSRFRLVVAYEGTRFAGSQRQAGARTVQGELERAAAELHGAPIHMDLAGRTDSGVHALGMVAAYGVETRLEPAVICRALNARLPEDLRVLRCEPVEAQFHPRFNATGKRYRYRLWVAEQPHPLVRRTTWHVRPPLQAEPMAEACRLLEGERDFSAFRSSGSGSGSGVRRLRRARLRVHGRLWSIDFDGSGFLRHQIRAMVGTLVEVGRGRTNLEELCRLLALGRRELAGPTAPAHGLILLRVRYQEPRADRSN